MTMDQKGKVVLTGIKPTDHPHLGNYLGAIRPGIDLVAQSEHSLLFIADYHALTTVQDAKELNEYTASVTAAWIACGVDPERTVIYRQSDVPEIFELSWILSCVTPKGLMNRSHAYKAKVQENQDAEKEDLDFGISMGLYSYPVLMAADILLFNTDIVPVGEDQIQHVEIARDIAQKFNRIYGPVLKLPNHLVKTETVVPGLDGRKMSKSYGNHIPLFLESKKMRKMIMRIITDSTPPEAPKETKGSVLFQLYKEFASVNQVSELENLYREGVGWGEVKQMLFERIEEYFKGPSSIYNDLMGDREKLNAILKDGALRARDLAEPTMKKVREAVRGHI
jgi:tryptophanyl-tRNA synthetase